MYLGDEEVDQAKAEAAQVIGVGLEDRLAGGDHAGLVSGGGGAEGDVEGVDAALHAHKRVMYLHKRLHYVNKKST